MRLNIFLNDNVRGSLHLKGGLPVFGKRRQPSHNRPRLSKEEETIMGILFRFGRKYRMQWEEMRAPFREFGPTTSDKSPESAGKKFCASKQASKQFRGFRSRRGRATFVGRNNPISTNSSPAGCPFVFHRMKTAGNPFRFHLAPRPDTRRALHSLSILDGGSPWSSGPPPNDFIASG